MLKLAPSILSADFSVLGDQIAKIEAGGATYIHIDVMDGHFVPNLSLGIPIIESIRNKTKAVFDVHLMISNPEKYVEQMAKAGADIINFHLEATSEPMELIKKIKELGKRAAITIKMGTEVEAVYQFASEVDMILLMSIEPGFGGQKLMPESLERARKLRDFLDANNLKTDIQMDGGINKENLREVIESGINVIVAGSAIFLTQDITKTTKEFIDIFNEYGDIY